MAILLALAMRSRYKGLVKELRTHAEELGRLEFDARVHAGSCRNALSEVGKRMEALENGHKALVKHGEFMETLFDKIPGCHSKPMYNSPWGAKTQE